VEAAKRMGAVLVGKEDVFEKMRSGQLDFDKVICHTACFQALTKAKLGRILGPKGLMPSQRYGTVVENVAAAMKELVGKSDYRERAGVVRMAVGQLAFSDLELRRNIQAFMAAVKRDIGRLSMSTEKGVHEVVLSSTNSAGFSLTGEFQPVRQVAPGKDAPAPAPAATPAAPKPSTSKADHPQLVREPPEVQVRDEPWNAQQTFEHGRNTYQEESATVFHEAQYMKARAQADEKVVR